MKKKLQFIFCTLSIAFIAFTTNGQSIIPEGAKLYKGKKIKSNGSYELQPILISVTPGDDIYQIFMKFTGPPTHSFNGQDYYYSYGNIRFEPVNFDVIDIYPEAGTGNTNGSIGNSYSYNYSLFLPYEVATSNFYFELVSIVGNPTDNCNNIDINSAQEFPPTTVVAYSQALNGVINDSPTWGANCEGFGLKISQTASNIIQIEGQPYSNEVVHLSIYDLMGKRLISKAIEPYNQYFLESMYLDNLVKNNLYIVHLYNNEVNKTIKHLAQ